MCDDRHFERWASALLGVVCLITIGHYVHTQSNSRKVVVKHPEGVSYSTRGPMVLFRSQPTSKTRRHASQSKPVLSHARRFVIPPEPKTKVEVAKRPVTNVNDAAPGSFPAAQPASAVVEFKPLGYAERADGSVEAFIAVGSRVFLAHEGDIFADRYKVLKVSASAVQAVDTLAQPTPLAEPRETLSARLNIAAPKPTGVLEEPARPHSLPSNHGGETPPPAKPHRNADVMRNTVPPTLVSRPESSQESAMPPQKEHPKLVERLGFIEMAGGTVKDIVAEGNRISLVPRQDEPSDGVVVADTAPRSKELMKLSLGKSGQGPPEDSETVLAKGPEVAQSPQREKPPEADGIPAIPGARAGPEGTAPVLIPDELTGPSGAGPPRVELSAGRVDELKTAIAGMGVLVEREDSGLLRRLEPNPGCRVERAEDSVEPAVSCDHQTWLDRDGNLFRDPYPVRMFSLGNVDTQDETPPPGTPERGRVCPNSGIGLGFIGGRLFLSGEATFQKPTPVGLATSTPLEGLVAGPGCRNREALPTISTPHLSSMLRGTGRGLSLNAPQSRHFGIEATVTSIEEMGGGITPLPLVTQNFVSRIPGASGLPLFISRSRLEKAFFSQPPPACSTRAAVTGGSGNSPQLVLVPVLGETGTGTARIGTGSGLLLHVSIADNDCHLHK